MNIHILVWLQAVALAILLWISAFVAISLAFTFGAWLGRFL